MVDYSSAPMQQNNRVVGFRFQPTDEELVGHYLRHKLLADDPSIYKIIPEIDLCKFHPRELPAAISEWKLNNLDDPEFFFFSPRDYKYSHGTRSNRTTKWGYWKVTGKDRYIKDRDTGNVIGTKKTLVFYQGCLPGKRTNWVVHEYHDYALLSPSQRTHVICKLLKKSAERKTEDDLDDVDDKTVHDESEANDHSAVESENLRNVYILPQAHQFTYMDSSMMTLTPPESSYDFGGSMIHTADDEVDSNMQLSGEFDFRSFLRLSPNRDEQD